MRLSRTPAFATDFQALVRNGLGYCRLLLLADPQLAECGVDSTSTAPPSEAPTQPHSWPSNGSSSSYPSFIHPEASHFDFDFNFNVDPSGPPFNLSAPVSPLSFVPELPEVPVPDTASNASWINDLSVPNLLLVPRWTRPTVRSLSLRSSNGSTSASATSKPITPPSKPRTTDSSLCLRVRTSGSVSSDLLDHRSFSQRPTPLGSMS